MHVERREGEEHERFESLKIPAMSPMTVGALRRVRKEALVNPRLLTVPSRNLPRSGAQRAVSALECTGSVTVTRSAYCAAAGCESAASAQGDSHPYSLGDSSTPLRHPCPPPLPRLHLVISVGDASTLDALCANPQRQRAPPNAGERHESRSRRHSLRNVRSLRWTSMLGSNVCRA